ncbi:MAG TPA: PEP-CTERM sorting domain-containing protein [Pyrinomonadaceae bacterium]|jgi:hypothetical protein
MLSVLLISAVPAQAGTIKFGDVIALATINGQSGRPSVDLRLRSVTQQSGAGSQDKQTAANGKNQQERKTVQAPTGSSSAGGADSSITGTNVPVQQSGSVQVETIELGDIQGTICDCGELPPLPGGGFPKLPLLALAGIPLLFLGGDSDIPPGDVVIIPPPDVTPPPQVPEPATLLLLGSGLAALGAGARRRRAARSNAQGDESLDVRGA